MRPIILSSTRDKDTKLSFNSGPGAPIFENFGEHTRIYRAPVRAIACARFEGKEIYGQIMDLSPGGCLFKTETSIAEGTVMELRVTIVGPDRRAVAEVRGIVRRESNDENRRAYGVEFVAENSTERRSLQWLYAQALR